jgi:hypothetical protein
VSFRIAPAIALLAALSLGGCQSLPFPTPTPTVSGGGGGEVDTGGGGTDVDVSAVEGVEASGDLVDPCSLLSAAEVEAALGVAVLKVVRGEVHDDGSQICAYAMDAVGSTAAAMAGQPGMPAGGFGDVINTLENGSAVVGVILSAQDPDTDFSDTGDDDDEAPAQIQATPLDLGKGGMVVATPNGGTAIVANDTNVLLTIMDLIAGPADSVALTSLVTTAYGRL